MKTILAPCCVPWQISPSMSGVTLTRGESDVESECSVVFGGGRLREDGLTDHRRIEITFKLCWYARTGPKPDTEGIEALGYEVAGSFEGKMRDHPAWYEDKWRLGGCCPDSGFYVAQTSAWLPTLPKFCQKGYRHYVISGRDGYVELVARSFAWREWLWGQGQREDAGSIGSIVGHGEGIA